MTRLPDNVELVSFDGYLYAHGDALLVHATIITADPHTAQDVVQAVLERAYQQWNRISQVQHLDAYVRRMVVNEFLSTRRRLSRLVLSDRTPETGSTSDHAGVVSDRSALIQELQKLPPRQRTAIALRYWGDLSDAQIAAEMSCSQGTVRAYIWRGLRRLKLQIEEPSELNHDPIWGTR